MVGTGGRRQRAGELERSVTVEVEEVVVVVVPVLQDQSVSHGSD